MKSEIELHDSRLLCVDVPAGTLLMNAYVHRSGAEIRVPSAILPKTFNYLYNPLHRDAKHVRIVSSTKANFDPRLLRHLRSG